MTEEEILAHGREVLQQCYQGVVPVPGEVPAWSFGDLNLKMFHEVWGDERLSMRDKRLVVLGIFAGRGGDPALLAIHYRSALRNKEVTPEELRAMMRVVLYYAGAPTASAMYLALETLLKETDEGRAA